MINQLYCSIAIERFDGDINHLIDVGNKKPPNVCPHSGAKCSRQATQQPQRPAEQKQTAREIYANFTQSALSGIKQLILKTKIKLLSVKLCRPTIPQLHGPPGLSSQQQYHRT